MYFGLKTLFFVFCFCCLSNVTLGNLFTKELTIEINEGAVTAIPIAIVPFLQPAELTSNLGSVVVNDLSMSGKFLSISEDLMLAKPTIKDEINFKNWRVLGVENLVVGRVVNHGSSYLIEFKLYDVFRNIVLESKSIEVAKSSELRNGFHQVSDLIYEKIIGNKGIFRTKIAYVEHTNDLDAVDNYRLMIADWDGNNPRSVLSSSEPILSPCWSPDGIYLSYVSFETGHSSVFIQNLGSGQRRQIPIKGGITGAPAFSPDGKSLAFTSSKDGNPDLFLYDLNSNTIKKLTRNPAIDTEASWSPKGNELVFTSDRGGSAQIYKLNMATSKVSRLTFGLGNYNANAEFSRNGQHLVMVSRLEKKYRIISLNLKTGDISTVSRSNLDESPSFSPNGEMIVYSSRNSNYSQLVLATSDGFSGGAKLRSSKSDMREPAWGPNAY